jgi:hypothetical protein
MSSDSKPAAKTILEIRVDRANEKGVFVAEQILNILHDTIDENNLNWRQTRQKKPVDFSCEIANIGGVIRFFFITDPAFKELIENQIYAHYPNVEITEVAEYLPQEIATVGSVNLSNWYIYPIKIYSQFKERTEKESVDPYSSLTSALAKAIKKETLVIQINFTPLLDAEWKDDKKVQLFLSNMPDWYKNLRSSSYGNFLGIFFSVLSFFLRSFVFLIQGM